MKILIALFLFSHWASAAGKVAARFYYDLGPESIDIQSYPEAQQAGYAVFARSCSACHTLARPINSPYITRKQWRAYVGVMHAKAKKVGGLSYSPAESKLILDFLLFDSKVRKLDHEKAFAAQTHELKKKFYSAAARK